jgi:diguanylate cyclase (GGDEF)-like protein
VFNITTGLTIWCSEAVTLAAVLFFAWRHDRRNLAFLMWSLGFLISAVGFALVAARGFVPNFVSIEIGNAVALAGESAWIAGFALLDRRKPQWLALLPPAIWLAGVFLPWVHDSFANRVVLYDLAGAAGGALLAAAVRPGEGRRETSRRYLSMIFVALACVSFANALAIIFMAPSEGAALAYRAVSALGSAFLITTAIALSGRLLMERSEQRWRALSVTDILTGVLNRRGLQDHFTETRGAARGGSKKIAALLFDLDHFKSINDRHGHQAGDRVLSEFARIAGQFIPAGDVFGRMGGEEFTAFVIVEDQTEAEAIADSIRTDFCRVPLLAGAALVPATVSVGVAIAPLAEADWDRLISAADRALYAAKEAGRNCTVVFGEEEAATATDFPPDPQGGELVPTIDDQIHALRRMGTLSRMS